jgi:hypothetical protein
VSQVVGKVASIDNPNNFILLPSKDNDICPVSHLKDYMSIAGETNIDLRTGYLFRAMDKIKLFGLSIDATLPTTCDTNRSPRSPPLPPE